MIYIHPFFPGRFVKTFEEDLLKGSDDLQGKKCMGCGAPVSKLTATFEEITTHARYNDTQRLCFCIQSYDYDFIEEEEAHEQIERTRDL